MKAIIYKKPGVYELVEKPIPFVANSGDVLIKIEASSICGSDVHICANPPGIQAVPETTIGHEMVGHIVERGKEVTSFQVGDRVVVDNNVPCMECYFCQTGHTNMCINMKTIGVDTDGVFAEFVVVPARMAVKISKDLPIETAIFAEPLNCVMGAIDKVRLLPGENVLVLGGGPIGLYFTKLLKLNGAGKVIVSEVSSFRADHAMKCGATRVINPIKENLQEIIKEETNGLGVDLVIDAVGILLKDGIETVKPGGKVLLFGNNASKTQTIKQADITRNELTVIGSYIGPHTLPATVKLLESGLVEFRDLITHRITLDQFDIGMEAMRKGEALEVVITPV